MAVTTIQTVDVATAIVDLLAGVAGVRTYPAILDTARPPCVVVGQPEIDWQDSQAGWCNATWTFPLTIVVARSSAADAQADLSRLVMEVATALDNPTVDGIFSIEPITARPSITSIGQQELPSYHLDVRVRA